MGGPVANPKIIRFGLFELDLDAHELRKAGVRIKLHEQPFLVLAMLLERPGAVVTREELQKKLWPSDTFVDFDLNLNSAVKKLRQALNDDSENPRFVETLYRRGYRFIGPVECPPIEEIQSVESVTVSAAGAKPISSLASPPARRNRVLYLAIPMLLLLAVGVYLVLNPKPPRVLGYRQITHDGLFKSSISTDGQRVYFTALQNDHYVIGQVSVAGGETSLIPSPFENVMAAEVAPNGAALLLSVLPRGSNLGFELWSLPLPSGPARRLGDFLVDSAAWSPDGNIVFSRNGESYEAKNDGSEPRKLPTTEPVFSPDGKKLRFDQGDSIWEMSRDGSGLRPLLPGLKGCCGRWTADGRYFLFQSDYDGRPSLFALHETSHWLGRVSKPVLLTNGPLSFSSFTMSKDANQIFVLGEQPRCEPIRFDGKSGFVPYMDGISATDLAFSADGKWVAYVSVPERQLWRSSVDGSEKVQLTFDGINAGLPRWSPDGKHIVFMGERPKTDFRAYLISSDGSGLRELIPGAEVGYDPGWSPDGKSIVLTLDAAGGVGVQPEGPGIATYELETKKITFLPGAQQLFSPRWSPDGKYILALINSSTKMMLFDWASQTWQELLNMPVGYPSWSHDGKYIYFDTTLTVDPSFFRLRLSDHKVERLVSLKGTRRFYGYLGAWSGLTPDDTPLLIRDTSSQEIYALDWETP
jgi:Tol biopolymer transport system component/DNA-binding winged helix-turn-helix (wHTH) protein